MNAVTAISRTQGTPMTDQELLRALSSSQKDPSIAALLIRAARIVDAHQAALDSYAKGYADGDLLARQMIVQTVLIPLLSDDPDGRIAGERAAHAIVANTPKIGA